MLRWEPTESPNEFDGFSGEERVAAVYLTARGRWDWHVMAGYMGMSNTDTLDAAKAAAEQAFKDWCARTGLGPAIPEGWQAIPVTVVPELVQVRIPTNFVAHQALAEAWASIDGKLELFRLEKDAEGYGTGTYVGYIAEAEEMIDRLKTRGFEIVPIQEIRMNTEGGSDGPRSS